jgi:myo-inositol-1(or 4)-monophosphatase
MQEDYADEFALAKRSVREAGKILMLNFGKAVTYGKFTHDIGTKPEVIAEKRIIQLIQKRYPEHNVWAEESGIQEVGGDYTWIIDPLDGTRNYVFGIPYFSVSIAFEVRKEVVFGVVYNPYTRDMVYARKGQGAFAGRKRLFVAKEKQDLAEAVICSDWGGSEKNENTIRLGIRNLEMLILASRVVVVHFSPALDLCQIAMGKVDALVNMSTEVEDHAAGALIVQEAGGVATNFGCADWNVRKRGIIAANQNLHAAVQQLLQSQEEP